MNYENEKPPSYDSSLDLLLRSCDWDYDNSELKEAYSRALKSKSFWDAEQGTSKQDDKKKKRRCAVGEWICKTFTHPAVRISRQFYDIIIETFDSLIKRNEYLNKRLDSETKRRFKTEDDLSKTEDQLLKAQSELIQAHIAARIEVFQAGEQQWALEEKLYSEYQRRVEAEREADKLRAQIERDIDEHVFRQVIVGVEIDDRTDRMFRHHRAWVSTGSSAVPHQAQRHGEPQGQAVTNARDELVKTPRCPNLAALSSRRSGSTEKPCR
ncbi:hypothetical protein VTN00DRAFT_7589 [Thermoascus crustaceus]|uniref:uncharacterized protein n=1 Tax=Thermoascus crustaceus TaxID=5088 RepID=UPI00374320BD